MAVNWSNNDEVKAFKESVVARGADPMETERYIESKRTGMQSGLMNAQPTPRAEEVPTIGQPMPITRPVDSVSQPTILAGKGRLGTAAGVRQEADVFSNGVNWGRDVAIENGVPVSVPQGDWLVEDVYGQARNVGRIGDGTNNGYGNSVLLINGQTGEKIRVSHLSPGVKVKRGQKIAGGTVVGQTGQTGNTSGPHLDIEYYDRTGKIRDIMQSPYGKYLMGGQQ